jgi:uncharacterized protein (TIGR02466 family)
MASVLAAFSKPIYRKNFKLPEIDLASEKWVHHDQNSRSVDCDIFARPEFRAFRDIAMHCVEEYFYGLMETARDTEIYITGSWINSTARGQSHRAHTHPNSILSGTMYIDGDYFTTRFMTNPSLMEFQYTNYNLWNSKHQVLEFDKGDVCIFPGELSHAVDTYTGDKPRITIAWNTFVRGVINESRTIDLVI